MRVLLQRDGVLHCLEVFAASPSPRHNELVLESHETTVTVSQILPQHAQSAVRVLYAEGMVDLSGYPCDI